MAIITMLILTFYLYDNNNNNSNNINIINNIYNINIGDFPFNPYRSGLGLLGLNPTLSVRYVLTIQVYLHMYILPYLPY